MSRNIRKLAIRLTLVLALLIATAASAFAAAGHRYGNYWRGTDSFPWYETAVIDVTYWKSDGRSSVAMCPLQTRYNGELWALSVNPLRTNCWDE